MSTEMGEFKAEEHLILSQIDESPRPTPGPEGQSWENAGYYVFQFSLDPYLLQNGGRTSQGRP